MEGVRPEKRRLLGNCSGSVEETAHARFDVGEVRRHPAGGVDGWGFKEDRGGDLPRSGATCAWPAGRMDSRLPFSRPFRPPGCVGFATPGRRHPRSRVPCPGLCSDDPSGHAWSRTGQRGRSRPGFTGSGAPKLLQTVSPIRCSRWSCKGVVIAFSHKRFRSRDT